MTIKVSIYEDNASLLESLSYLIRGVGVFELCTASKSAVHILDDCKRQLPDVIIMGIDLSEKSGLEATMLVKATYPEVNVMMFTIFDNREKIFAALEAGATGYLLKTTPAVRIIEAVEELYQGGSPMSGIVARKVLVSFSKQVEDKYKLTKREQEVLYRLVMGDSYKMVADSCFISIGTVYSHINNIYKKLQINSKSEAVIKAIKERLV